MPVVSSNLFRPEQRGWHDDITVRAEIITELILERAGQVIFKTFLLKLIAFTPIPVIFPAREAKPENYWKR